MPWCRVLVSDLWPQRYRLNPTPVLDQTRPDQTSGSPSGTGRGFSPGTSVFICQYYYSNTTYSSSSIRHFYQKDKRAKTRNFPDINDVSVREGDNGWKSTFTLYGLYPCIKGSSVHWKSKKCTFLKMFYSLLLFTYKFVYFRDHVSCN